MVLITILGFINQLITGGPHVAGFTRKTPGEIGGNDLRLQPLYVTRRFGVIAEKSPWKWPSHGKIGENHRSKW